MRAPATVGTLDGMSTAAAITLPVFDPRVAPANDQSDPVALWLALREPKARVLERVERLDGVPHFTAEVRLGEREGGVYRLAVTLALRAEGSTREALRELVRGWCRARGVRCRAWAKGLQGDPTRRYGRR